jgi:4-hydroxybenzoate polyprenyltransferase
MQLGVFSTSILFGYTRAKQVLTPLLFTFFAVIYTSSYSAGLHALILAGLPTAVLLPEMLNLDMSDPKSCGRFALKGIITKYYLAVAMWGSLLVKAAF